MSHYFEQPAGPERRREVVVSLDGEDLRFVTANGVFSGTGLDPGTAVLLRSAPFPVAATRLLDLGCGWGPIAIALALRCPGALVDAVDVNDRALALCADNATELGVGDRVAALRPDEADHGASYDEIWSNPPIRIGKDELHALLLRWLPRLAPGGRAQLVVARNLGADSLQRWLVEQGYPTERLTSAKGFRVLTVQPVE